MKIPATRLMLMLRIMWPKHCNKIIFLCAALVFHLNTYSQASDYISLKRKNRRTVVNFYAGSVISFQTTSGASFMKTPIKKIANDSVYLQLYTITTYYTNIGTRVYDTLSTYIVPIHYGDIEKIFRPDRYNTKGLTWWLTKRLWIGTLGYIGLNLINDAISKNSITEHRNIRNLSIAAGIFAASFLTDKRMRISDYRKGRFKIVYVNMQ